MYEDLELPLILSYDFLSETEAFTAHVSSIHWLEEYELQRQTGHLSIIKICEAKMSTGHHLLSIFKNKKTQPHTDAPVVLPNTQISVNANSAHDHGIAERELLRRMRHLQDRLAASPEHDRPPLQAQFDQCTEDWNMLLTLKPKPAQPSPSPALTRHRGAKALSRSGLGGSGSTSSSGSNSVD